ncbi:MAG: hypothetical protein RR728_11555, partial [Oscillospiraceae bacterium]
MWSKKIIFKYFKSFLGRHNPPPDSKTSCRQKPTGDYNQVYDFMDGYAMVGLPGESVAYVVRAGIGISSTNAMIIDKTGKEVLSKTYPAFIDTRNYSSYPQ